MSKSYEAYKAAQICRFGVCRAVATHRYATSRRLSHCAYHATDKMILSTSEERCVADGCILIAIYKYDNSPVYTHCYYHSHYGQRCEPVICSICGTVASYKCSITNQLYCRSDYTDTSFNMKVEHCRGDVHTCAKIDLDHCKKIKHKCIVRNCKSMAGHYIYNIYKTHCYKHSSKDYITYSSVVIPPTEIVQPIQQIPIEPTPPTPTPPTPTQLEIIKPIAVKNKKPKFDPDALFV